MKIYNHKNTLIGIILSALLLVSIFSSSCQKFLEEKPMKSLKVPKTLDDLQAILNIHTLYALNSAIPEALADNYYVTEAVWLAGNEAQGKFLYNWDAKAQSAKTWDGIYGYSIYYPNVVLDKLAEFKELDKNSISFKTIKGEALFYRAFGFYQLAQLYCQPYSESAKTDLGLALRMTAAIETPSVRATVQQTYDQIINDLNTALTLLPPKSINPTKPDKAVIYGVLARCYLSMQEYTLALNYANLCLQEHSSLIDYNSIIFNAIPFKRFNSETIYYSMCNNSLTFLDNPRAKIDSLLYESYDPADLRKTLFFRKSSIPVGSYEFSGCYDGDYYESAVFNGITTGEMYLTRAECYARDNKKELALSDLNTLMKNRWSNTVPYPTITASSAEEALEKILIERRKELVYRGLRWSDIRRFNLEGQNITLKRNLDGVEYTLPPNDLRWVMLIPDDAINRSEMKQNPRE